ncbi:MAG: hypothetical protein J3K34DRAFT_460944 [Monoraphidium minutum]|nr:MAG: hypothetical protein J3K34DRAFT_460944 [Monoraphidium minutum]
MQRRRAVPRPRALRVLLAGLALLLAAAAQPRGARALPSASSWRPSGVQEVAATGGAPRRRLAASQGGRWEQIDGVGGRLYDQEQHWHMEGARGDGRASDGHAPAPKAAPQPEQRRGWRPQDERHAAQGAPGAAGGQQQQQQQQRGSGDEVDGGGGGGGARRVPLAAVAAVTLTMVLASGLGAAPFFLLAGALPRPWAGLANAVASGVMLAASFGLLAEGGPHGGVSLVAGMVLGAAFVKLSQQYLEKYEVDSFEELRGADARRAILFLAVMAAHAVGEGGGVGVSFSGERGWAAGTTVALAIGLHNIPEGLAVATVLAARGASPRRLLLWTTLTALPQALAAVPAFLFVEAFAALLPGAMGFAAGCMAWIVAAELLPDALDALDHGAVATAATMAAAWLQGLAVYISHLERGPPPGAAAAGPPLGVLALGLLLPALVPGVAAGMAANLAPSRPAALGLSAGALAAGGALGGLGLLARGAQAAWVTVLLAGAGAGAAAIFWREAGGGDGGGGGSRRAGGGGGVGGGLGLGLSARIAMVGGGGAALSCCSSGAALAGALLAPGGEIGLLMAPMALHAALAGLSCFGALVPAAGSGVRRIGVLTAAVCAAGPAAAIALLPVGPAAYGGAAAASAAYAAGGEALAAAAAGWGVYAGAVLLLPQARAWHVQRARAGVAAGAALAAAGALTAAGLCVVTPYCLRPASAS